MRHLLVLLTLSLYPAAVYPDSVELCQGNCHVDKQFFTLVRTMEGFSPFVYKDIAGHATLCFGHLVKAEEHFDTPMTGEACEALLEQDVAETEGHVNRLVKTPILTNQHDALVDFTFNLGVGTLEKSTLLVKANAAQHCEVPAEINKYVYADHVKSRGLQIRRSLEAKLYAEVY